MDNKKQETNLQKSYTSSCLQCKQAEDPFLNEIEKGWTKFHFIETCSTNTNNTKAEREKVCAKPTFYNQANKMWDKNRMTHSFGFCQ